jgi:branched-chain amino acid transport system ATP-binding protein
MENGASMEALNVESLSKEFGGVTALNEINIKVDVGEKLAIIGPNGAGKSTLFNVLCGQLKPTKGNIYFYGEEISKYPVHKRCQLGLARSFQLNSLCQNLTVLESMMLAVLGTKSSRFGWFKSVNTYKEHKEKAHYLLQNIDLIEHKDKLVKDIGYGEQRKLEISLSLASDYKMLLMDEPTAGLTNYENEEIVRIINEMAKDTTLLIVTHDIDLILKIVQRTIVLNLGQLLIDGETDFVCNDKKVKELYLGKGESQEC